MINLKGRDYRRVIVTCMKDECPYILDWLAFHMAIGFTHFVIASNDCSDATERLCRNLEKMGIITHFNNKEPHPRGIQKTAWKRAAKFQPIQEAEWLMALDVDEYFVLGDGFSTLDDLLAAIEGHAAAISFPWQMFGHNGITEIEDISVREQFTRSAHPLQAKPYQIRGFKTLYRRSLFEDIGTHRPHKPNMNVVSNRIWANADGAPSNHLFVKPHWCVWDDGTGFGTTIGRIHHYAIRSKEAFFLKMIRGFVNRTAKGVRATSSPLEYWNMFDWNVYEETAQNAQNPEAKKAKEALLSNPKIKRLHNIGFEYHKEMAEKIMKDPASYHEEFPKILELEARPKLSINDPVLAAGSPIPLLFEPEKRKNAAKNSLIRQPLITSCYRKWQE